MNSGLKRFSFEAGATLYDFFTFQQTWREHSKKLSPDDLSPERILDVGCGPGISSFAPENKHPDSKIIGVDIAAKMIERASRRKEQLDSDVTFVRSTAEALPFGANSFDLVTGHSFLYLLDEPGNVLVELNRVLQPNGRVAFLEPKAHPGFQWIVPSLKRGGRFFSTMIGWQMFSFLSGRFTRSEAESLLRNAGFHDTTVTETLHGLGWILRGQSSGQATA